MSGILDAFKLDGKVAIVTGSERGLGRGHRRRNLRGERPRKPPAVQAVGRRYAHVWADLATLEPIGRIVDTALREFGHIDILVNTAGIIIRDDSVDFTEKEWNDVMDINVKVAFFLSQAVARQFIRQDAGGKIINVALMFSFQGSIRVPSYTASKSGVKGITMLLVNEWARHGINVNAITSGYMATDITAQLRADEARSAEILGRIPAGRWGLFEGLSGAVVFLASKASDYVNGHIIAVDGGWLAR
jgi:2-deoxy-D-gluconate 3-dehydrogenase